MENKTSKSAPSQFALFVAADAAAEARAMEGAALAQAPGGAYARRVSIPAAQAAERWVSCVAALLVAAE